MKGRISATGIAALAVASMWGATSLAQSPKWHHVQGGTVNDVVFFDDERGCTAEDGGRIRYTEDGGLTWEYADVPDGVRGEIFAVVRVSGTAHAYACGDGGVILRSTDAGKIWSDVNVGSRVTDAHDDPARLHDIFMFSSGEADASGWVVGDDGAIAFTTNNWTSWTRPDADSSSDLPIAYTSQRTNPNDIYDIHFFYDESLGEGEYHYKYGIFCADLSEIYLTSDGGDSWTTAATIPGPSALCPDQHYVEWWEMSFLDPEDPTSAGLVCGGEGTTQGFILRTTNGGSTWTQSYAYDLVAPNALPSGLCGIATLYDIEYVGTSNPVGLTVGYAQHALLAKASGTADYDPCNCSAGNPGGSPTEVWHEHIADGDKVIPSTAIESDPPFFGMDQIDAGIACIVGQFGRIVLVDYDGGSGGAPLFDDRATLWPFRLRDSKFLIGSGNDYSKGFVVGQGWTIWYTSDHGVSWTHSTHDWTLDNSNWIMGIDLRSSGDAGVCVGTGGFVAKGELSGSAWSWDKLEAPTEIPSNLSDLNAVVYAPGSGDVLYAVGNAGRVIKSEDGGDTWEAIRSAGTEALHGVSFIDEDVGVLCGADGKIFKTTSGGGSPWSPIAVDDDPTITFYDVVAWSDSGGDGIAAIAVGQGGAVYKKAATDTEFYEIDHGTNVRSDLFDVEVVGTGPNYNIRIVGANGSFIMTDGGLSGTWVSKKTYSSDALYSVKFQSATHGYAFGGSFAVHRYYQP